jgi:hypothetical protein
MTSKAKPMKSPPVPLTLLSETRSRAHRHRRLRYPFNPGLEAKVAGAVQIPVTSAVSSVTVALKALSATRVMLVTPFTADMNAHIEKHLANLGFTVFPGPAL